MIKNFLKIAYRSLAKNKVYTAINIFGLTVGIACCLIISLYVHDETSYDSFFEDSERIYRVALERQYPNNTRYFGSSPVNLAPALKETFDEIESAGRIHRLFFQNQTTVTIGEKSFIEENYLFADSDFFDVFSLNFVEGSKESVLNHPNQVVISESTARKFFGNQSAIDQTYRIDTSDFLIKGVFADMPDNSHMSFDILGSIHSLPFLEAAAENNSWINPWLYTYIKVKEGVDPNILESRLPELVRTYGMASILGQLGISEEEYPRSGHAFNYFLQPVTDIHLHSNLDVEIQPNSNILYIYLLSAIVAFILVISCINFVNLATARSTERGREVGVRKVLGSTRNSLVGQFLTESNFLTFGATLLAVLLVYLTIPSFNHLIGKDLQISTILSPAVLGGMLGFALIVGTLAGLYPAFVLSSVKSASVLKGDFKSSGKGIWLRNFLIIFQFFISVSMISATLLVNKQMNFMSEKSLGFDKENVVVIEQAQLLGQQTEVFKNNLTQMDGIDVIGGGFAMPGDFIGNLIVNSSLPDVPQLRTFTNTIDDDYIEALNLEVVMGRGFVREFNDSTNVLVNETTARLLGYTDPIGQKVINPNAPQNSSGELTIVGVVKDYHHHSLHSEIPPMILFNTGNPNPILPNMAFKLPSNNTKAMLSQIENNWDLLVPGQPLNFRFLDEKLQNLYEADQRTGSVFSLFTILAIILACIGLFGLAAYVTQQRTKEIGVRKVLGANLLDIIFMLSKNLTKLILVAYLASIPLVYYGMSRWLDNFAYHTTIDPGTLLIAGAATLLLAWLTISYYSIRAAVLNIVTCLRDE